MKRICTLFMAFILLFNINVFAASYVSIDRVRVIRDETVQPDQYLKIEPYDEVETGSSIVINVTNADILSQSEIDSAYQYPYGWNGEGFFDIMPRLHTFELPYRIRRITNHEMEIYLINVPTEFAGYSIYKVNGVVNKPCYRIKLPLRANGAGSIQIKVDSNQTTISSATLLGNYVYSKGVEVPSLINRRTEADPLAETTTEEITEAEKPTLTEAETEEETESTTAEPTIFDLDENELVAVRDISDIISADDENSYVDWDSSTKTVTICYKDKIVRFIHEGDYYISGDEFIFFEDDEAKAVIIDKKMYIPAGVAIEALGLEPPDDETVTDTEETTEELSAEETTEAVTEAASEAASETETEQI